MKLKNYVAPEVEQVSLIENYPFAFNGSGEDSYVSRETIDVYNENI